MIDNLIKAGDALQSEAKDDTVGKFFDSVNFEAWVSKVILYLENYYVDTAITEKAIDRYKSLNSNNNYAYYQFLLGSLIAIKEFENEEDDFDDF
ncbi:hypothetical protein ACQKP0_09035 [Heyndrickxia sp. NPDC080065]|uniref:hypothetical protein n=1 Tax=Heyndrickxia sp. NPDC080065 TaxID=3390568 RepID=UPI003D04BDE1